jgi:hypothetical protein
MKASNLAAVLFAVISLSLPGLLWKARGKSSATPPFRQVYDRTFKKAKYVDLTYTITSSIPVWAGFGPSTFGPATNPMTGKP